MNWKTELLIIGSIVGMVLSYFGLAVTKDWLYMFPIFFSSFGLCWGFVRKFLLEEPMTESQGGKAE